MRGGLIRGFICGLSAWGLASGVANAAPPLWVARSGDATVYLFGTVHVVKESANWQTPAFAEAFRQSRELWLEETDDDPATARPIVAELGIDREHALSTKVSASELAQIDAAAKDAGFPGEAVFEPMRPWLAAVTLAVVPIVKAGYDPKHGVDKVLKAEAEAEHKPVHAFETFEQQLHFLADLPPGVQIQMLQSTLDDVAEGPQKVDDLLAAWEAGDMAAIEKDFSDLEQPKYRDIYEALIVNRNHAWADRIAEMLQGDRVTFVAVGAGHFTGVDALQKLLLRRGLQVIRE